MLRHQLGSRMIRAFKGKVAMPILAERYQDAGLRRGAISIVEIDGDLCLSCAGQTLPLSPKTVSTLSRRASEAEHGGERRAIASLVEKINDDPEALDEIVRMQNYSPMYWRNGDATLNYRRFFTITSLAGIRIEEEWVFDQCFALVKHWLDKGWVDGLRVDHARRIAQPEGVSAPASQDGSRFMDCGGKNTVSRVELLRSFVAGGRHDWIRLSQ